MKKKLSIHFHFLRQFNLQRPSEASTGASVQPPQANLSAAESALLMGEEYNTMVQNIVDMGYERDQVRKYFFVCYLFSF